MTNPHHILIIEDEKIFRDNCATKLLQKNFCVSTATDGEQGLQSAFHKLPDIILLDLLLPKMNGAEVFTKLQSAPITKNIPIILLTNIRHFETVFGLFNDIEFTRHRGSLQEELFLNGLRKYFQALCEKDKIEFFPKLNLNFNLLLKAIQKMLTPKIRIIKA